MRKHGAEHLVLLFGAVIIGGSWIFGSVGRLTALAARMPMVSFWQKEAINNHTVSSYMLSGTGSSSSAGSFWFRAAFPSMSRFLEKEETVLAQADPAYEELKKEQELYRNSVLAAQAGAEAVQAGINAGSSSDGASANGSLNGVGQSQDGDGINGAEQNPDGTGQNSAAADSSGTDQNGVGTADSEPTGTAGEDALASDENSSSADAFGDAEPAMAAKEVTGTVYTLEELSDFEFVKKKFFYVHKSTTVYPEQLDASVLLGKDMTLPETDEVQILLFHTHGSEAFADSVKGDASMTVVGIGNYLAELLADQYGIQVLHNTEVFPYSDSYSMAAAMLKETLAEHPSIQVTIDLHRDSGGHEVVDINGKPTAPVMFFNGMCQTPDGPLDGVSNPYLMDNLAFNFQMKLKAEAYYPGFTLRTFLKAYRYNQHVLPRATLIEVGTEENTFEEARNAMEPLADLLYKVLRGK